MVSQSARLLTPRHRGSKPTIVLQLTPLLIAFVLGNAIMFVYTHIPSECRIHLGTFRGPRYSAPSQRSACLLSSKYLQVQQHTVVLPDNDNEIPDWLWIDYHDAVNVLVELAPKEGEEQEPHFLVFEQTKYGLPRPSLAVVGGIVEPGEDPTTRTAPREVWEETGLVCQKGYMALGTFRTDVNRGMGWTHAYLAQGCTTPTHRGQFLDTESRKVEESAMEAVGGRDYEPQETKAMSLNELKEAVMRGEFQEIKWSATVALAILHLGDRSQ